MYTSTLKNPVDTLSYPSGKNNLVLVILLRGIGNDINYFDQQGWGNILQQCYPEYLIVIPDLHIGYIREGSYCGKHWQPER